MFSNPPAFYALTGDDYTSKVDMKQSAMNSSPVKYLDGFDIIARRSQEAVRFYSLNSTTNDDYFLFDWNSSVWLPETGHACYLLSVSLAVWT